MASAHYKIWTAYTDTSVYTSLYESAMFIEYFKTCNFYLSYLCYKSLNNLKLMRYNFVKTSMIKYIGGQINTNKYFSYLGNEYKTIIDWEFSLHIRLKMNFTFTLFNIGNNGNRNEGLIFWWSMRKSTSIAGFRNKFIYIPQNKHFEVECYILYSTKPKLVFEFSVIDSKSITDFDFRQQINFFPNNFTNSTYLSRIIYFNEIIITSYLIITKKVDKITVVFEPLDNVPYIVTLFDGPDDHRQMIHVTNKVMVMSLFQCFLKLYCETDIFCMGEIKVSSKPQKAVKVNFTSPLIITQNMCKYGDPLYCLYNITIEKMYLNISFNSMTFYGPTSLNCLFGGVAFYQQSNKEYFQSQAHCRNYSLLSRNNLFDPQPNAVITSSSNIYIIVFGYYPYIKGMKFSITITLTPCKGLLLCAEGTFFTHTHTHIYIYIYQHFYPIFN